jgi:hypothetical protein
LTWTKSCPSGHFSVGTTTWTIDSHLDAVSRLRNPVNNGATKMNLILAAVLSPKSSEREELTNAALQPLQLLPKRSSCHFETTFRITSIHLP